jgi:hypothetical protein
VHVFRDETAIGYGDDIRDTILEELEKADVLVALIAGGAPAARLQKFTPDPLNDSSRQ